MTNEKTSIEIPSLNGYIPKGITVNNTKLPSEILINHKSRFYIFAGLIVGGLVTGFLVLLNSMVGSASCGKTHSYMTGHICEHSDFYIEYGFFAFMLLICIWLFLYGIDSYQSKTKISIFENGEFEIQKIRKIGLDGNIIHYYPDSSTVLRRKTAMKSNAKIDQSQSIEDDDYIKWKLEIDGCCGKYTCDGMLDEQWKWLEQTLSEISPKILREKINQ